MQAAESGGTGLGAEETAMSPPPGRPPTGRRILPAQARPRRY